MYNNDYNQRWLQLINARSKFLNGSEIKGIPIASLSTKPMDGIKASEVTPDRLGLFLVLLMFFVTKIQISMVSIRNKDDFVGLQVNFFQEDWGTHKVLESFCKAWFTSIVTVYLMLLSDILN